MNDTQAQSHPGRRWSDQFLSPANEREAILLTAQAVGRIEEMVKTFQNEVVTIKADVGSLQRDKAAVWGAITFIRLTMLPVVLGVIGLLLKSALGLP